MGSSFMKAKGKAGAFAPSSLNLEARAGGAGGYASRAAGAGANKDIGAAMALVKAHQLKPTTKDVVSNLKGPKI